MLNSCAYCNGHTLRTLRAVSMSLKMGVQQAHADFLKIVSVPHGRGHWMFIPKNLHTRRGGFMKLCTRAGNNTMIDIENVVARVIAYGSMKGC